jgi:hypothetical protein
MEGEEVYSMMRNIFTSRWSNTEEEEEVVVPKKKKSISPANSVEKKICEESYKTRVWRIARDVSRKFFDFAQLYVRARK